MHEILKLNNKENTILLSDCIRKEPMLKQYIKRRNVLEVLLKTFSIVGYTQLMRDSTEFGTHWSIAGVTVRDVKMLCCFRSLRGIGAVAYLDVALSNEHITCVRI